ncbi:MAG: hypothetical protein H6Q21_1677, partial [Bacteroidetes bacterium]|nr:hypothetical protein [Bacteroidota bacterium]
NLGISVMKEDESQEILTEEYNK